jgi:hypothetical protein
MKIPEYQLRVAEEKRELDAKTDKLATFLTEHGDDLSKSQYSLMHMQWAVMCAYSTVLKSRLEDFVSVNAAQAPTS